jgi:hypothetical protein
VERVAALLMLAGAVLCFRSGASSIPSALALDMGSALFYWILGVAYALAAVRIWRRDRSGAWLVVMIVAVWAAIMLREGRLLSVAGLLAFLLGPVLGLVSWRQVNAAPVGSSNFFRINAVVFAVLFVTLLVVAPLWSCHLGFGGDYHCHSALAHSHVH